MAKKNRRNIQQHRARSRQRVDARRKQRKKAQAGSRPTLAVGRGTMRAAPLHEVLLTDNLFAVGIGHLVVSRSLPNGQLAIGIFMIDVRCMGVKDAFLQVGDPFGYVGLRRKLVDFGASPVDPAYARKLLDAAVGYARGLGFEPGGHFKDAYVVIDAIDASTCTDAFVFGVDGKPHFMSGPYDSPAFIAHVTRTLEAACGKDGYNFTIAGPEMDGDWFDSDEDDEDTDEIDDEAEEVTRCVQSLLEGPHPDDNDHGRVAPPPPARVNADDGTQPTTADAPAKGWLSGIKRLFKKQD